MDWQDGEIKIDSPLAKEFGFISNKFEGYLWKTGNDIYISFIISKQEGKGNLRKLFDTIIEKGYNIKVPTPFPRMEAICKKLGFKLIIEKDPDSNEFVEIMYNAIQPNSLIQ